MADAKSHIRGIPASTRVPALILGALFLSPLAGGPVTAQTVYRPPTPEVRLPPTPEVRLPPTPPLDPYSGNQPGSGSTGRGSLEPSIKVAPTPKFDPPPEAARPLPAAPAPARAARPWCVVAPGSLSCWGNAPPDGGGSDDLSCDCSRNLCRDEFIPGSSLTRRICYR